MRPIRQRILAAAALLTAALAAPTLTAQSADQRYVSDELLITFRTQPSTRGEIIRNLTSGTQVRVLEDPEGSEWARVALRDGREGWVRKQYLQDQPVARDRLEAANREVERLTRTVTDLRERLETVQQARSEAETSSENLDARVAALTQELAEIKRVSASAIETAAENRRLTELNDRLRGELDELVEERDLLAEQAQQRWMMIGGGLVLLGLVLGVIIKARPRRSAWT